MNDLHLSADLTDVREAPFSVTSKVIEGGIRVVTVERLERGCDPGNAARMEQSADIVLEQTRNLAETWGGMTADERIQALSGLARSMGEETNIFIRGICEAQGAPPTGYNGDGLLYICIDQLEDDHPAQAIQALGTQLNGNRQIFYES